MPKGRSKERKARDGEVFYETFYGGGVAIHTSGNLREILEGPVSARIQRTDKFGWELHYNAYVKKGGERIEVRNPSEWDRIDIYVPINEETIDRIIEMDKERLKKLEELRQLIKGDKRRK